MYYMKIWQNMNVRYGHFLTANQVLKNTSVIQLIHKYTVISTDHLTPEIKLHIITPKCTLWHIPADDSPFRDPYWAFYWPGGQSISRYILDHSSFFKNLNILDIGCGCGACSIAAFLAGAKQVIANDVDDVACTSAAMNAQLNNAASNIRLSNENFLMDDRWKQHLDNVDCVLIGDMFYNEEFSTLLIDFIAQLLRFGKTVLVGDPGRLSFHRVQGKYNERLLAEYILPENSCLENNGFTTSSVWQFY